MYLINHTRMLATYTVGLEPNGRELFVVVVKGTFELARGGERVRLSEEQQPFVMADRFSGDPATSAPIYEVDFALRKQRCDVLVVGRAYAPGGRAVTRVRVGIRVGEMSKTFDVVGNRVWKAGVGIRPSAPEPFVTMPISYDRAFGGADTYDDDPNNHAWFRRNPVGRGFHKHLKNAWLDGTPLPNTEEVGTPIDTPDAAYQPMALGPLGRAWEPRASYAGTYDQKWLDTDFPFLPGDFDDRYYQAAPIDQQLPVPTEEQTVTLLNLTPDGRRDFRIPFFQAGVRIVPKRGEPEDWTGRLDTIVFEPDEERLSLTWRVARPLKRNIFEISQVIVGNYSIWRRRPTGELSVPLNTIPGAAPSLSE